MPSIWFIYYTGIAIQSRKYAPCGAKHSSPTYRGWENSVLFILKFEFTIQTLIININLTD